MKSIEMIDVFDLDLPERTASYYLSGDAPTLIETSAAPSIPFLLQGLEKRAIHPESIKYVILTHIHLDHAGGAGLLLESLPNATVLVHERGRKHLIDPSRLIESAKEVYGEAFKKLFDPIVPIPESRIRSVEDGETLDISEGRTLTFYDTPGHAKHHLAIHDGLTNSVFTGDTLGTLYPTRFTGGTELILPSTSPIDFDPNAMIESMKRIRELNADFIYFGHYGFSEQPDHVYHELSLWLDRFIRISDRVFEKYNEASDEELVDRLSSKLFNKVETESYIIDPGLFDYLTHDLNVSAQGMIHYLRKEEQAHASQN